MPFATVALVAADDSVVVDAGRADEQGAYLLMVKRAGQYQVLATAVGFCKGRSIAFAVGTGSVHVPDLRLLATSQVLGEVQVVGRKSLGGTGPVPDYCPRNSRGHRMNILILEDEILAAHQTVQFLERAGLAATAPPVVRSVEKSPDLAAEPPHARPHFLRH